MTKFESISTVLKGTLLLSLIIIVVGFKEIEGLEPKVGYIHLAIGTILLIGSLFGFWKIKQYSE